MTPEHSASLKLMAARLLILADHELSLITTRDVDQAIDVAIQIDDAVDNRCKLAGTPMAPPIL